MCIRDRRSRRAVQNKVGLETRRIAAVCPRRSEGLRSRVEPVSYTHLRAHETVLDLVCRLLLEKNKSQGLILYLCGSTLLNC